jgi:hypothetical protein
MFLRLIKTIQLSIKWTTSITHSEPILMVRLVLVFLETYSVFPGFRIISRHPRYETWTGFNPTNWISTNPYEHDTRRSKINGYWQESLKRTPMQLHHKNKIRRHNSRLLRLRWWIQTLIYRVRDYTINQQNFRHFQPCIQQDSTQSIKVNLRLLIIEFH